MLDLLNVQYDLVVISQELERLHLFQVLDELQWEENEGELAVRLSGAFRNMEYRSRWLHTLFPNGAWVLLYSNWGEGWEEVFRGRVFRSRNTTNVLNRHSFIAYDALRELMQSKDDRYYPTGTTGRQILDDIFTSWGLSAQTTGPDLPIVRGEDELPEVGLAQQTFRGTYLAEMIQSVLTQTKLKGGGTFVVKADKGKIHTIRRGTNTTIYHFGQDLLSEVDDDKSIEDLVTRVKILGSEDTEGNAPIEDVVDGLTQFGVFQEVIYSDKFETPESTKAAAQEILKERGKEKRTTRLECPDLPFLRRGDMVHVTAGTLDGYFLVSGVQHDAKTRRMTFSVEDLEA